MDKFKKVSFGVMLCAMVGQVAYVKFGDEIEARFPVRPRHQRPRLRRQALAPQAAVARRLLVRPGVRRLPARGP